MSAIIVIDEAQRIDRPTADFSLRKLRNLWSMEIRSSPEGGDLLNDFGVRLDTGGKGLRCSLLDAFFSMISSSIRAMLSYR